MTNTIVDPKSIAAVRALAKLGSFRAAAEAENTSPASFSRRIARAEDYVGLQLFDRRSTGAVLTLAGNDFLDLVQHLESAEGQFRAGVERLREAGGGRLAIGAGPLTTRAIIVPVLESVLGALPDLRVRIIVRADDEPLDALRRGNLDIALCDLTHTANLSDLDVHVIKKKSTSFWARPEHPIHARGTVPLTDIFREGFVSPFMHKHWRSTVAKALGDDAEAWQLVDKLPQIECDDYSLLTDLAARLDVLCGGVEDSFSEHAATGRLKKIDVADDMQWNICAARRKGTTFPALDLTWKTLIDRFGT